MAFDAFQVHTFSLFKTGAITNTLYTKTDKPSEPVYDIAMTRTKEPNNAENSISTFGKCKKELDHER